MPGNAKNSRLQKFRRAKKSLLGWFAVFLLLIYCYWLVMTNLVIRDFWDPQYAGKIGLLRDLVKSHPGKPLCVIIGSSKVDYGVRPGVVRDLENRENSPLLFNFGLGGSDMFRELICLRRMVADGVKPQRVGIEVFPVLLCRGESAFVADEKLSLRARKDELAEYNHFASKPDVLRATWLQSRWNPAYQYGMRTQLQTLPLMRLVPVPGVRLMGDTYPFDQWGWSSHIPTEVTPEYFRAAVEHMRGLFWNDLQNFSVSPDNARAMTELLDFCKAQKIEAFLIVMPEPVAFQKFYSPQANQAVHDFIEKFKNAYGLKVINARSWISDDKFLDGLHLIAPGAEEFTRRFVTELENAGLFTVTPIID